uniref:Uncharacterized protein n=1 Tax=Anguilla anguilla TaxID=7936 RepID=A0A0E9SYC9_ANGAN
MLDPRELSSKRSTIQHVAKRNAQQIERTLAKIKMFLLQL